MKTSPTIDKLSVALLAAQKEIGNAGKNAANPHFKSKYADLSAIIEATKEPFNKNGISVVQGVGGITSGDGSPVITVYTRLQHTSGEYLETEASAPLPKADPQGVGSATTYLRRYSLAAIACITQEDDDGNAAQAAPIAAASSQQLAEIDALAESDPEKAIRVTKALDFYKVKAVAQLNTQQASQLIGKLKGTK